MDDGPPLAGLRVLDFSRVLAGPFCSAMLADAGAEVIKVEPPEGDDYRHMGLMVGDRSANFDFVNRGKRSLVIDLKREQAGPIIERLTGWADLVLENFRPGVADRLGIGYARLSAIRPDLVYCSLSGFGQTGPWADRPAYDAVIQALSGLIDASGEPDGPPTLVGESIADVATGLFASWGVMAALWQRSRTGRGRHLDIAMYDCLLGMMPTLVSRAVAGGLPVRRVGLRHVNSAPFGAFRALDGLFVLAVANNRLFARLADVLGDPVLASDPRFADNAARKRHEAQLTGRIEAWSGRRTARQAVDALLAAAIPAAPVLSVQDSVVTEHVRARGVVTRRDHAGRPSCFIEQPVHFGTLPRGQVPDAPALGADTRDILGELGFEAHLIDRWFADAVVA
jgi:CoA:oxalate CoA-transferase